MSKRLKRKPKPDVDPMLPDLCTVQGGDIFVKNGVKAVRPTDPDWAALTFWQRVDNMFPFRAEEVSPQELASYNPGSFEKNYLLRPPHSQEGMKLATLCLCLMCQRPRPRGAQTRHHTPRCRTRHCALGLGPGP